MSMQRVPTLKKDMNAPVMMDSPATGTYVKTKMSVKFKLTAAIKMLNARIHLGKFS